MSFTRTRNPASQQQQQQQPPPLAPGAQPNCRCQPPVLAVQRTVRKPGRNQGRVFFTCHMPMGQQCGYFEWGSPEGALQPNAPQPQPPQAAAPQQWNNQRPPQPQQPQQPPPPQQQWTGPNNRPFFPGQRNRPPQSGAAPHPSPFAARALSAAGAPAAPTGAAQNPHAHGAPPQNGQLKLALADLEHLCVELGPLLPRAARTALTAFKGAETRVDKGVQTLVIPTGSVAAFRAHAQREARCDTRVDPPDWVLRGMAAFRGEEARRERLGDVVTQSLDELLPPAMCDKLMQFQWHGIHFALKHGARCLIADDMGLGKTLQAIAIARVYQDDWPLLVICPSSLRLNWKHELLQWLADDLSPSDIRVIMSGKDLNQSLKRVNIVSYDLARKIQPDFVKRCQFIIADESHYLKSMSALRSKAVIPLLKNARRAILLSGTPALSRPVELFPQLHAVSPTLFPSYSDFVNRYCNAFQGRFGLDVSGSRNLPELHNLLTSSVLIRRRKDDVLKQLPEKQRQLMWVETKPSVLAQLRGKKAQLDSLKAAVPKMSERDAIIAEAKLKGLQNEMYQLSADAKIDSIKEVCKVTAESGVKFIVFAHHASVMNELCEFILKKLKLGIIRIDGGTPQKDRQGLCNKFQEQESCRVAVLSITAAGVGLTLTQATAVVFAELYWNPGSLLQAEDRAHRIGQRSSVLVKYLLAKDTLDEQMWQMVRKKLTVVGQSLTGKAGRMDAKEHGKEGDEEIDDEDGKGSKDIRNFFKRKAEKRARTADQDPEEQDGPGKSGQEPPIVSQAHNDEVVVIDDDDTGISSMPASGSPGLHATGSDDTIDLDAPIASHAALSRDGSQPSRKKARRDRKPGQGTVEDALDDMFPEDGESLEGDQPVGRQASTEVLVDDDLALARRLQAEYNKEANNNRTWELD